MNIKQLIHESTDINSATEAEQIAAVSKIQSNIRYIDNPSETVQLAAVRGRIGTDNMYAIQFIPNPSEAVKLASLQYAGHSLRYIRKPSEEMKLAAVTQSGTAIRYIDKPSDQVKLVAVNSDSAALINIKNPSRELQLAGINEFPFSIDYIKNPSDELVLLACLGMVETCIKYPKMQQQFVMALRKYYKKRPHLDELKVIADAAGITLKSATSA